jgi:hypothetical protein
VSIIAARGHEQRVLLGEMNELRLYGGGRQGRRGKKKKNLRIKHCPLAEIVHADMSTVNEKVRLIEDGYIVSQNHQ